MQCLKYQIPVSGVQTLFYRKDRRGIDLLKYQIPVSGVQTRFPPNDESIALT